MNAAARFKLNRTPILVIGITLIVLILGYALMGQDSFVRTALSGMTLGSLYFMVAAGLTLIFGLMDVLNFAHGAMFMLGGYLGWQFYTNPSFLFAIFPLILALITGLVASRFLRPLVMKWHVPAAWVDRLPTVLSILGILIAVIACLGLDFLKISNTAPVAIAFGRDPLFEIKPLEPLAQFSLRIIGMLIAGLIVALGGARPGDTNQVVNRKETRRGWIFFGVLAALTLVFTLAREALPIATLQMDGNIRFFLALTIGAVTGAGIGAVIETSLIRPLYIRPIYQVMVTMGLAYVLRELVMLLWGPVAYQMVRPPMFAQPGEAANLLEWFANGSSTIDIFGVTFPTYRLFIIFLGVLMLVILGVTIGYSRLGMIIRAGVQDREMVEALGINVRQVFTIVFMIGAGLAALGGIGAAPFIPIEAHMGDLFQLQAFICVVIGGMGSFGGAAIGAILLGLARAFGDYLALRFGFSPAIAEASTVIIMAVVLLVRPAGLFGRKE